MGRPFDYRWALEGGSFAFMMYMLLGTNVFSYLTISVIKLQTMQFQITYGITNYHLVQRCCELLSI